MNLNELWSGNDYAWYEWRGRGEIFRYGAVRVQIIRTFKKRADYTNERLSGFAEVIILDEDGTPRTRSDGSNITREVRARDIAMRWDEYAHMKARREAERERLAKEAEEKEAEENRQKSLIIDTLVEKYNLPREAVYNITATGIHLNRAVIEKELNVGANHAE